MRTTADLRLDTALSLPPCPAPAVSAAELASYAFTYLFRGGAVLTAALSNYALAHSGFAAPWLPWLVLMPLSAVVLAVRGRRQQRRQPAGAAPSATTRTMRLLQKSFVLALVGAMMAASFVGWETVHPLLLLAYGLGTAAAGRVLSFRPLLLGGAAAGALGLAAMAAPADVQLLLIALAMLLSYLIPGYLLRAHSRLAA